MTSTLETELKWFKDIPDQKYLFLPSAEEATVKHIASAITRQHLKDRSTPYLENNAAKLVREEAWRNIANLNPEFYVNVVSLMRGFEIAKAEEEACEEGSFDWAFRAIRNSDSRTILIDILAGITSHFDDDSYEENILYEEAGLYNQLGKAVYGKSKNFPNNTRFTDLINSGSFPRITAILPQTLMEMVLEEKVNSPRLIKSF